VGARKCLNLNPGFIKMVIEAFFAVHTITCPKCNTHLEVIIHDARA